MPSPKITQNKARDRESPQMAITLRRYLYFNSGIDTNDGTPLEKVPLEDGAKIVKISKKTLDDYLSQIKKGHKYGFNFNDHKN
jgi:hypothetical protein